MHPSTEPDFTDPHWQPYLDLLGVQARTIAADLPVPADLEAVNEAAICYAGDATAQLVAIGQQVKELEGRKAAGALSAEEKARRCGQLSAWVAELMAGLATVQEEVEASSLRHGIPLPPPPSP